MLGFLSKIEWNETSNVGQRVWWKKRMKCEGIGKSGVAVHVYGSDDVR